MAHNPGNEDLKPGIHWYAGFIILLLLLLLPGCKHGDRYAYQQIKEAYDQPKKPLAVLPERATDQPGKTPENALKAAGALTLQTVIQVALQNNPDMDMAVARIGQSEAMLDEAQSAFWPVISVYGEYLQGNAPSAYLFKTIDQRQAPSQHRFQQPGMV